VIQRYGISLALAVLMTLGLLSLMQSLVARGRDAVTDREGRTVLDFVRLPRDESVETKRRELPKKQPVQPPASAPMSFAQANPVGQVVHVPVAAFHPELSLAGGPSLGGMSTDSDVVPLVRVAPSYPPRAQARGIEGWVHLEFTITPQGTVDDIVVLDSDPKGYFERAARTAVQRYKYKPRIENGVAVVRPGVQVVISFDLED
jgi:protein TonB